MTKQTKQSTPVVDLALQGGGAHGAFTWGVLDALLEDGRLAFEGATGASAGAMNAVVMADGWARALDAGQDPREGARERLKQFWESVSSQASAFSAAPGLKGFPGFGWVLPPAAQDAMNFNPMAMWFDVLSRMFSPYQLNPMNFNPLAVVLGPLVDFERLRKASPIKLFVCATNVRTGRARVFRDHELRLEMLLASACLPFTFQAVRVSETRADGTEVHEHYWDGGYMGNPALFPLGHATKTRDLLLVQINPLVRPDVPNTSQEIVERANEISFNASLMHEMRTLAFVQRMLKENRLDAKRYKQVLFHAISAEACMRRLTAASKYDTSRAFVRELFDLGRNTAVDWLDQKLSYVGHASSVNISEMFL